MSTEHSDFALWGDDAEAVEDDLDISDDLRLRLKGWAREYERRQTSGPPWARGEMLDHDRRGVLLGQELQAVLGHAYFVTYVFNTAEVRAETRSSRQGGSG